MTQNVSIVHYCNGLYLVGSRNRNLFFSDDRGVSWRRSASVVSDGSLSHRLRYRLGIGRLGRRLVRGGIRHAVVVSGSSGDPNRPGNSNRPSDANHTDTLIVVSGKRFYRVYFSDASGRLLPGAPCVGSNPLCTPAVVPGPALPVSPDLRPGPAATIYYGEYRPNPERSPVHVWRSDDNAATFHPAWTFPDVRHVHGVFPDPFDPAAIWVTTGDDDSESAIRRTDDSFRTLEPVVRGGQQARAVDLIFTVDALYFGSDTPREQNWWYRLDRRSGAVERQIPVGGSVFWARTTPDGWRLFSTVVEKSSVNFGRHAELWAAPPGNDEWRRLLALRKDPFHDKYFDHGQIRFAAGPGIPGAVWVTPYAVQGDQRSLYIELTSSWDLAPRGDGRL